jgi:alpha-pyrone synthase
MGGSLEAVKAQACNLFRKRACACIDFGCVLPHLQTPKVSTYLNRIATVTPPHDVHAAVLRFARTLLPEGKQRAVYDRLARQTKIEHRFSVFETAQDPTGATVDAGNVYARGHFPSTQERMKLFEKHAPDLAAHAVRKLKLDAEALKRITHVIVTTCTGMYAPGVDFDIVTRCGLSPSVERTMIGFMGCYAAVNGLKLARHIVRSAQGAHVLLVNVELCTLHLQESHEVEPLLSFLIFGDGCAASIVSSEAVGFELGEFYAAEVPNTRDLITWHVGNTGFDMFLSGKVPAAIAQGLEGSHAAILGGARVADFDLWAVHPGGRSILDAVAKGFSLKPDALDMSRDILRRFGNMSSATIMFVLEAMLAIAKPGDRGCGMSFGPGLVAETFRFQAV